MAQRNNLYRRSSGIYVLRLTVPARFRLLLGQREIHASTATSNPAQARTVACRLLGLWDQCLSELEMVDRGQKNTGSEPAPKGVISVNEISEATGLQVSFILRELLNHRIPIMAEVNSQPGYLVDDFLEVDREADTGGFVLNSAFEVGSPHVFSRFLRPFDERHTILNIIECGYAEEVVFRTNTRPRGAAFFDLPGIRLTPRSVLLLKIHADRFSRTGPSSASLSESPALNSDAHKGLAANGLTCENCRPERADERVSSLMATFFERRQSSWKPDQQKKMATQCGTFVELMNDPPLGALNRQMIWSYEAKLRKMPADRYNAARRHKTNEAHRLIALAEELGEDRLSSTSVERYLDNLSSMFAWAKRNQILTGNPAERAIEKPKKTTRDQDDRSKFESTDLDKIFTAQWFATGAGERNKHGRFHRFRPHFYWLPLLGLYTGARLNELSQLYTNDVKVTEAGVLYLDFNLDGADKVDADGSDKSLKTVNAKRIVAVHPNLIELGLHDYVRALSAAGHLRLFPELKHDAVKGYGKPAGSWFNERFLGNQLKIQRDGTRTFHSFRHTFITALSELNVPADIQSQLAGHSRGGTITLTRYRKDAEADRLLGYVKQLDFKLPAIAPFSIADGLDAVRDALRRKAKPTQ
ncbi:DUF6538 domain-containing protein [Pseudomonas sp. NPDC089396]|uniref:DUF6538 domain-containing protein n=1 Tax=Pseudomonas sp. NPDC089396 TaxID=3364461 RepID=UPI00383379B4